MAKWGKPRGLNSPWGIGPGPNAIAFGELAKCAPLIQMNSEPPAIFRDVQCIFAERWGNFVDVMLDVLEGFDLDAAQGAQLNAVGSMVGLPRNGFGDDRYRVLLNIQIDLILSARRGEANWTGTVNNLLRICRTFIGPTGNPIIYVPKPPYDFELTIPDIATIEEFLALFRFLCIATYAGVLGRAVFLLPGGQVWDSGSVGPLPNGGIWGSASVAVAGSGIWSLVLTIGTEPCE